MICYNSITRSFLSLFILGFLFYAEGASAQDVSYPPVKATKQGALNPLSPDPVMNYHWANPQASDGLESYVLKATQLKTANHASFDVKGFKTNGRITVKGMGDLRFDFGQENAGWLEFDSPDLQGNVEMSVSEYTAPANRDWLSYPKKTMAPKKHGNTYRLELNPELYEGVRFGWIHVRSFSKTWHITAVRLVCQTKPANYQGSFACSDPLLTKIWYTGAYTVKLNLLKDYFGAILMNRGDRISWTGDAHPSQAASMVAFGNFDFVKKNIEFTSTQSNGIRSYALYWVLSLLDYYRYTGDKATLDKFISNACGKLDDAYKVYGNNPNLVFYGWDERLGSGFEHPNVPESENAYKMLSIRAWNEFAAVMGSNERTDLRDKYEGYATEKIKALRTNADWYKDLGLHAGADAVTTGLLTNDEKNAIHEQSFTDRVNRVSYSPFNQYFIIQAFARMNKYDEALSSIRDLWGGQLKYGGTTFFEDFRSSWNAVIAKNAPVPNNQCGFTSLCHPWGAGVTKWLSEEVLGIKPTSAGFATVDIVPHLARTLTSVSGKTPTPFGAVAANVNVFTGKCSFVIPKGITARIGIPKVEKNIRSIKVNGKLVWDGKYHSLPGIGSADADPQFIYLNKVQPGSYKVDVAYTGKTPPFVDVAEQYVTNVAKQDSITGGNWGGHYGKEGYVLCNYNGNGVDKTQLPSYVSSVDYYKFDGNNQPLNTIWEPQTTERRALAADAGNDFPRKAACLYAMDADQIGYTFTTTINVKEPRHFKVSLYFLDWDDKGREIAVEMFDAKTSKLLAPVQIVKNCQQGKYITFACDRAVKFRINVVRGVNAVLSGIFFDQ